MSRVTWRQTSVTLMVAATTACGDGGTPETPDLGESLPADAGTSDLGPDAGTPATDAGAFPVIDLPRDQHASCAAWTNGRELARLQYDPPLVAGQSPEWVISEADASIPSYRVVLEFGARSIQLRAFSEVEPIENGRKEMRLTFVDADLVVASVSAEGQLAEMVPWSGQVNAAEITVTMQGNTGTENQAPVPWNGPTTSVWSATLVEEGAISFVDAPVVEATESANGPLEGLVLRFSADFGWVGAKFPGDDSDWWMCGCEGAPGCSGSCEACAL